MLQIATGVVLVMHYTPHVSLAFASVEHIMRDVNGGWALRYVHANGASLFFFAVYCHIFRGIYYGSYKEPREITWIIGMLIYLLMMATAFMGYVLPWGQMSFWGATVITGLFSALPLVGPDIQTWLLGGPAVDNPTLNRFFSLHYLLPFVIAGLVIVHIWAFHTTGNNNPTGVEVRRGSKEEAQKDTLPFWPYFVIKDLFALVFVLAIFAAIVGFMPNFLGHPDNYIEANALKTPAHIVPEWYFLPFYAMLRAITFDILWINSKLAGVLTMFGSIAVLLLLPWLDTSRVRSGRYRPMFKVWFWLLVVDFVMLMWCGSQPPEQPFVIISQLVDALLVRLLPRHPADPRHHREAAAAARVDRGRLPRPLRHGRGGHGARRDQQAGRMSGEGATMLKTTLLAAAAALGLLAGPALAQEHEAAPVTDFRFSFEGPFGRFDQAQLQRGLQVYTEVCSACHGLKFLPYRELAEQGGPSLPEEQMRAYAAMHDVDRRRHRRDPPGDAIGPLPASPVAERAGPQPDGQGAGRLPRPGRAAVQPVRPRHRRARVHRLAAARLHRRRADRGRRHALREPRSSRAGWIAMPPPLTDDGQVTYADGTVGDRSSRWRRTWPPS